MSRGRRSPGTTGQRAAHRPLRAGGAAGRARLTVGVLAVAVVASSFVASPRSTDGGASIDLVLPLPAELPVTASFGEYRRGHLHAGLDFSTRGELGWPVRAAADGEIFRLKVEKRGYGRALYIRHAGGHVTVYGHLHAYEDGKLGLERFVREAVLRAGRRFPGDLYPDPPVPVRAGQVIGLSGENGGGPPHLHFELRRDGDPVDPTRYGGLDPRGFAPPVLDALWILPRGACRIDGRWGAARFPFVREGGAYRLRERPRVEGRFDLELTARVPGAGTMGLARVELVCGDRRLFRADLHRFSFAQGVQSGLVYDPVRSRTSPTRFTYRLRAAPGLDLPGVEGAWLRTPEEGLLACTLTAEDPSGRRAAGEFTLDVQPSPGYAEALPSRVREHALHDRLLLVNGDVALDPLHLSAEAARIPGMPQIAVPGRRPVTVRPLPDLEVRFPEGAMYAAMAVSLAPDPDVPPPAEGLEVVVPPVRLEPAGVFLRREARWRARVPDPGRSALYVYDPSAERWTCLGKEPGPGIVEQGARWGGTFAILRDTIPPRILSVQIREEKRLGARRLVFPVHEAGEGIDVEAFHVEMDGTAVEAEYDPDRQWGQVWLPAGLAGQHAVRAWCRDRAENPSARFEATVSF